MGEEAAEEGGSASGAGLFPLPPVTVVAGHYGAGKTNFSINLALDAAARGYDVVLADLDVVNPYFRSSDYRGLLEERGVRVIAPVMAGTTLDSPSISGQVSTAIDEAQREWDQDPASARGAGTGPTKRVPQRSEDCSSDWAPPRHQGRRALIIDAGGDDVGATALGRFAPSIARSPYALLYLVNRCRNLTQQPAEAVSVLREIEAKARLRATAVVNNTHLKQDTDEGTIALGVPFARAVADELGLPLACTTVPAPLADRESALTGPNGSPQTLYPVQVYVRTPWE